MNHYETLGVKRDASVDEIRKAYRKKIRKAHPDREGGDSNATAELNVAYETLSDPQRRIHYDQTGQNHVQDITAKANGHLMGKAMQWVAQGAQGDMVQAIKRALHFDLANAQQGSDSGTRMIENMERVLRKLKYKGKKDNLIKQVIQQNIDNIRQQRNNMASEIDAVKLALEMADDYEYTDEQTRQSAFHTISFSGNW